MKISRREAMELIALGATVEPSGPVRATVKLEGLHKAAQGSLEAIEVLEMCGDGTPAIGARS